MPPSLLPNCDRRSDAKAVKLSVNGKPQDACAEGARLAEEAAAADNAGGWSLEARRTGLARQRPNSLFHNASQPLLGMCLLGCID